jgi:hypothetical protein
LRRDSERVREGYERAVDLLRASQRKAHLNAPYPTVRKALDDLDENEKIDRQIAMFWLDLSYDQLQARINTQPPPTPFPPKRQGKASKRDVLDWDRAWRSIEAERAHARVVAKGRPMTMIIRVRKPWLVFPTTPYGMVIVGHAEQLTITSSSIVQALRDGATIRWLTVNEARNKEWALGGERSKWQ